MAKINLILFFTLINVQLASGQTIGDQHRINTDSPKVIKVYTSSDSKEKYLLETTYYNKEGFLTARVTSDSLVFYRYFKMYRKNIYKKDSTNLFHSNENVIRTEEVLEEQFNSDSTFLTLITQFPNATINQHRTYSRYRMYSEIMCEALVSECEGVFDSISFSYRYFNDTPSNSYLYRFTENEKHYSRSALVKSTFKYNDKEQLVLKSTYELDDSNHDILHITEVRYTYSNDTLIKFHSNNFIAFTEGTLNELNGVNIDPRSLRRKYRSSSQTKFFYENGILTEIVGPERSVKVLSFGEKGNWVEIEVILNGEIINYHRSF